MLLSSFLNPRTILIEQDKLEREQIYKNMIEAICKHYNGDVTTCDDTLLTKILERDKESSVGYPSGLAIPHVRLDDFNDTVVCLSFLKHPIDYEGVKVRWIAMILTDKASSRLYLNIVAGLLRVSKDAEFMGRVFACVNEHDIFVAFDKEKIQISKGLHLEDIMTPNPITVGPDYTLGNLNSLINKYGHAVYPVVDKAGHFLGEVHILNLLKIGVPDYLLSIDNLNFLQSVEPLQRIFEQEHTLLVQDFMDKEPPTLEPSASIIETVSMMINHQKRVFCVVEDGSLKGVIAAKDIVRKVIRA
jgi:PTS system nitrogen regulatory IIA component